VKEKECVFADRSSRFEKKKVLPRLFIRSDFVTASNDEQIDAENQATSTHQYHLHQSRLSRCLYVLIVVVSDWADHRRKGEKTSNELLLLGL
jgi:hypothetical protein